MKKFITVAASAALAVSMLGFSACGNSEGTVKGNYSEPTAEEFNSAVSSIDMDKAFGDGTKDTGFEILSKLSADFSTDSASTNANLDLNYKMLVGETTLLGSGTASVKTSTKENGKTEKGEYSATVYNDAKWAYAEITGISDTALKGKLDLDKMMTTPPTDGSSSDTGMSLPELFTMCAEYKIGLGLDTSNGVKIKASVTEDTIWALLAKAEPSEEAIASYKEIITFNTFKLDAYLAFDKDGLFSQASIDMNIDIKVDGDKLGAIFGEVITPGVISGNMTFKVKGYFTVKAYSGTVTLPEGIENDPTYLNMTDMIGGIIG